MTVESAESFEYNDPVDKSVSSNQGIKIRGHAKIPLLQVARIVYVRHLARAPHGARRHDKGSGMHEPRSHLPACLPAAYLLAYLPDELPASLFIPSFNPFGNKA